MQTTVRRAQSQQYASCGTTAGSLPDARHSPSAPAEDRCAADKPSIAGSKHLAAPQPRFTQEAESAPHEPHCGRLRLSHT
eukprot:scaffold2404_cov398-Prasinococcus_capsulatus_cf.AAC.2